MDAEGVGRVTRGVKALNRNIGPLFCSLMTPKGQKNCDPSLSGDVGGWLAVVPVTGRGWVAVVPVTASGWVTGWLARWMDGWMGAGSLD